jgi:antitoxin (DNA-binding transcriptional repressor) of toxin-antitoxin stability system
MQTKTVDVHEAQTHLVELLSLVTAGIEIILTEGSTPLARIVPMAEATTRVAGLHPGAIWTSADFDAPLPEEFWTGPP